MTAYVSVCAHMCEVIGEAYIEIIPVLRSVPVDILNPKPSNLNPTSCGM